jgi:hypothetical protein
LISPQDILETKILLDIYAGTKNRPKILKKENLNRFKICAKYGVFKYYLDPKNTKNPFVIKCNLCLTTTAFHFHMMLFELG